MSERCEACGEVPNPDGTCNCEPKSMTNPTELQKAVDHWEQRLKEVEANPLNLKWTNTISASDLRLFVDAAKYLDEIKSTCVSGLLHEHRLEQLSAVQKENEELKEDIRLITTDKNYVGGTQYWISKYDEMLHRNADFIVKFLNVEFERDSLKAALESTRVKLVMAETTVDELRPLIDRLESSRKENVKMRDALIYIHGSIGTREHEQKIAEQALSTPTTNADKKKDVK